MSVERSLEPHIAEIRFQKLHLPALPKEERHVDPMAGALVSGHGARKANNRRNNPQQPRWYYCKVCLGTHGRSMVSVE